MLLEVENMALPLPCLFSNFMLPMANCLVNCINVVQIPFGCSFNIAFMPFINHDGGSGLRIKTLAISYTHWVIYICIQTI